MPAKEHGRLISKAEAQGYYQKYAELRKAAQPSLEEAFKNNNEQKRLHCGRPGRKTEQEDVAYIFDKNSLSRILQKLENDEAHGIIIFHGARASENEDGSESETEQGRPTLMIFPYEYETPANPLNSTIRIITTQSSNKLRSTDDGDGNDDIGDDDPIGAEHPGTGGTGTIGDTERINPFQIPVTISADDIHIPT